MKLASSAGPRRGAEGSGLSVSVSPVDLFVFCNRGPGEDADVEAAEGDV